MDENRPTPDSPAADDGQSRHRTRRQNGRDDGESDGGGQSARPRTEESNRPHAEGAGRSHTEESSQSESEAESALAERSNGRGSMATDGDDSQSVGAGGDIERPVRELLHPGESLNAVRSGTLVGDAGGPATIGLTDGRFLVVTDAGEFVTAGFEKVTSVRTRSGTVPTVRGNDARLLSGVGYLLAVFGFIGVLAGATNPLTPMLTLATLGGALALTHVRQGGLDVDESTVAPVVEHLDDDQTDRLRAFHRQITDYASEETLALWSAAAVTVLPFLVVVGVERGLLVPLFALVTVGSILLVVHAFRHGDAYDGIEFDWRRRRTVTASLDDGTTVSVQTPIDSDLDRKLAGHVGATASPRRRDIADPS